MTSSHPPHLDAIPPDLRDALASFDFEADQIVDLFLSPLNASPPPPIIYHYTNDVGLRGILETGQLWLTAIFNLNDPSELRHGLSLGLETLNEKAATGPTESKIFAERLTSFSKAEFKRRLIITCARSVPAETISVSGAHTRITDAAMRSASMPGFWKPHFKRIRRRP
jgi:hypothetical protein